MDEQGNDNSGNSPETRKPDPVDEAYGEWAADPAPEKLKRVVDRLEPTINYTLSGLDARGDPSMEGQARLFAARAVKKYDPSRGAGIKTHVSNQLKQMNRYARRARNPLRVPERAQLEKNALYRNEMEFLEQKGREPSTLELADWSGIPVKRLRELKSVPVSVSESRMGSGFSDDPDHAESGASDVGGDDPDFLDEAMDYVYTESDPKDQRIFEGMTGYSGSVKRSPAELAERMQISQSQISRRFARMMSRLQDIQRELEEGAESN